MPAVTATLHEILSQELETANALFKTLLRERSALRACAVESMLELADLKKLLSQKLEILAKRHHIILVDLSMDGRSHDFIEWLRETNRFELIPMWMRLGGLLAQCQHQNTCNSHLIASLRRYHHAVLDIFHRQSGRNGLYDSSGKTQALIPERYSSLI